MKKSALLRSPFTLVLLRPFSAPDLLGPIFYVRSSTSVLLRPLLYARSSKPALLSPLLHVLETLMSSRE